jgi:hypothetical protein
MAVLVEAISVIVRADAILSRFACGWDAFQACVPNATMCADGEVARVGFMMPDDAQAFVAVLEEGGLVHLRDDEAIDLAVVDQLGGHTHRCDWLEFGHLGLGGDPRKRVAACRLAGSASTDLITPPDWSYAHSLSRSHGFVPAEHLSRTMKFLRREGTLDVYLDLATGQEMYVGRTGHAGEPEAGDN